MSQSTYNIFDKDISEGLNDVEISNGMDYIILLKAPVNANVKIRINDLFASQIPLSENFAVSSKGVRKIYISCDAVVGEKITIGQSDTIEGFQIITSPVINGIEEVAEVGVLNDFSTALLDKMDKIINPYLPPITTTGEKSSASLTTILNKTLTCDKISLSFIGAMSFNTVGSFQNGSISIYLDGVYITGSIGYSGSSGTGAFNIELENIKNKTLEIKSFENTLNHKSGFVLQEYTLKT